VERGSDKHGPLVDETLKHETEALVRAGHESHVEEWREAEPAGEDEPEADLAPDRTLVGGTPPGLTPEDVEGRAELAEYLRGAGFPAVREQLIWSAEDNHAPERIVDRLRTLPSGRTFDNVAEVWVVLGGGHEEQRF
jgi:hypothetical protein